MGIVQRGIVTMQQPSPTAQAAAGLTEWEEGIEHQAIHTVVVAFQQFGMVPGKCVGRGHRCGSTQIGCVPQV
jgi:hypothetical protein